MVDKEIELDDNAKEFNGTMTKLSNKFKEADTQADAAKTVEDIKDLFITHVDLSCA